MNTVTKLKQGSVVVGADGFARRRRRCRVGGAPCDRATSTAHPRDRHRRPAGQRGDPRIGRSASSAPTEARQASDHVLGVVERVAPGLDVDVMLPLQDARQALIDISDRASIVVVGTRGRGPVRSLLLGSVSTAVAAHGAVPGRRGPSRRADDDGDLGPVVVGVDGSPASASAVDFAFDLASTEGRELEAVHCWPTDETFIDRDQLPAAARPGSTPTSGSWRRRWPATRRSTRTSSSPRTCRTSSPVAGLVERSETAAVLVVGSRGRSGVKSLVGSVSRVGHRARSLHGRRRPALSTKARPFLILLTVA